MDIDGARGKRALWITAAFILLFNGLLVAWLLMRPGSHALLSAVDNVAQFAGPLLLVPLCFGRVAPCRRHIGGDPSAPRGFSRRCAPIIMGASLLSYVAGQVAYTYYEQVLHYPTAPFPSWADAGFLAYYPILLLGILLLPARPLSLASRTRVVLDSLIIMTAIATFSWYFVLGPTILQGGSTLFTQIVGAAYPLGDLVLMGCLLLLWARTDDPRMRFAVRVLTLGLVVDVVTDSVYDIQQLHGTYHTGGLLDVGWTLAYMLVGLAAYALRLAFTAPSSAMEMKPAQEEHALAASRLWRSLLPYMLVPPVGALAGYTWLHWGPDYDDKLEPGIFAGAAILVGLLLLRQVLTLLENRRLYQVLRASKERFELLFMHNPQPMWVYDKQSLRFLEVNDAAVDHYGYSRDEFLRMRLSDIRPEEDRPRLSKHFQRERADVALRRAGRWRHRLKDGRTIDVDIAAHDLLFGKREAMLIVVYDITERVRAEEALQHQALHDALTGLPNRALLQDRAAQALCVAARERRSLALLLLDLDRFKEINDTFGHQYGDLLLQQVGDRLRGLLRRSDTVARLGGDEFAVLVLDGDPAGARHVAAEIHEALDRPFVVEGQSLQAGASIGVALYPDHGDDMQTLLRHADVAMYAAKRGHNGYALYEEAQNEYSAARLALAGELRRAVEHGELLLHYQPKVEVGSGRVCAVEALVRWQHPQRGLIPPDLFIPLAEGTGLIAPLTRWVLEAALRQCRAWQSRGIGIGVAVNLSTWNLHDPGLVDTIGELLASYGVSPASLCLELTESAVMADAQRALDVLTRLAALGVHLSIDDFGTGYSSLAYLKRLPVAELKIDKSFVLHMGADESDASIVSSTIGLGHSLGLRVVAEGVEDELSWNLLAGLGCDVAQGYYLSRPLPAAELECWLSTSLWSVA